MTRNSDFKAVVRARAAETGETYTAARAALEREAYDAARAEQERLVARLFTAGRIERVPARRKVRAAVLLEVLARSSPGGSTPRRRSTGSSSGCTRTSPTCDASW